MLDAIALYVVVVTAAIPYAIAFCVGDLIVTAFMKMAFGGKVEF